MVKTIKELIQSSIDVKSNLIQDEKIINTLNICVNQITNAFKNGNKVLFCGNGGSAADAQHLAAEFSGRFYIDRKALPAEALHCNTSYLTAVGNDYGYDVIYSRILDGIGNKGDILIGLSTSGNSSNIINAVNMANSKEMITIGLTGNNQCKMDYICTHVLKVPSTDTPRIQESHILLGHIICQLVEEQYFNIY